MDEEMNDRLFICGADELDDLKGNGITHMVRIANPGVDIVIPSWFSGEQLQLFFGDVVSEADAAACRTRAPDIEDVRKGLAFARAALGAVNTRLLVSCDYGASRSPALAYVLLADQQGAGKEQESFHQILQIRPDAMPNEMVVGLGDSLLGRNGLLLRPLKNLFAEIDKWLNDASK